MLKRQLSMNVLPILQGGKDFTKKNPSRPSMVEMELEEIRLNMSYEVLYITILHFIHKYIYIAPPKINS